MHSIDYYIQKQFSKLKDLNIIRNRTIISSFDWPDLSRVSPSCKTYLSSLVVKYLNFRIIQIAKEWWCPHLNRSFPPGLWTCSCPLQGQLGRHSSFPEIYSCIWQIDPWLALTTCFCGAVTLFKLWQLVDWVWGQATATLLLNVMKPCNPFSFPAF